jgi:hypothetical protein
METKQGVQPGYETRDASIGGLLVFGAGLFGTLVLVFVAAFITFRYFAKSQSLGPPASPFADIRTIPPQPRLQVQPRMDLRQLRQQEDNLLSSYGWVDPKAGIIRMPIDRAMDRLLERGVAQGESKADGKSGGGSTR